MSTVAIRSSSGWSYPVLLAGALAGALDLHRPPNRGDGKRHKDRVIYTHVLDLGPAGDQSPADRMSL